MKTISVRIKAEQGKRLQEIIGVIPGGTLNGTVQRAVELWLDTEGPVYKAAFEEARNNLRRKDSMSVRCVDAPGTHASQG